MPFFRPHLVILQPLKPQLAFDPLVVETVAWLSYQSAVGRNAAPMVYEERLPAN